MVLLDYFWQINIFSKMQNYCFKDKNTKVIRRKCEKSIIFSMKNFRYFYGHRRQLRHISDHLLLNAQKYATKNKIEVNSDGWIFAQFNKIPLLTAAYQSVILFVFQSIIWSVWFLTAPPLDRRSRDPSTPQLAVPGRWCSWESSPLQWHHVWKIGRSHKQTSPVSFHQAPRRVPDRQTQFINLNLFFNGWKYDYWSE